MDKLLDKCKALLQRSDISQDLQARYILHVKEVQRYAKHARWIYPLVYLLVGTAAATGLFYFGAITPEKWDKFLGAVIGLASALIAFWQPKILLRQEDCEDILGKRLAASDLQEFNSYLSLPSKQHDDICKLIGAFASFLAVYLTLH